MNQHPASGAASAPRERHQRGQAYSGRLRNPARWIVVVVLLVGAGQGGYAAETPDLKTAIERGLKRVEAGSANYTKHRQCFSCHHQAVAIEAMVQARKLGLEVEKAMLDHQLDFTINSFKPKTELMGKGEGIGGASTTVAYGLVSLKIGDHPADDTTAAMVAFLLRQQKPDGSWKPSANRPPTEGSTFTTTAQSLRALKAYEASVTEVQRERFKDVVEKGRGWLLKNEPQNTEDRVFRLLGLAAAGVEKMDVDAARDALLKDQQDDGGWRQLDTLASDAYATGTVLAALHATGSPTSADHYQKGMQYLLRTQKDDGSWFVETRSRPIQTFFDNGDPGGKSQFISFAATSWALVALLPALESKP